MNEQEQRLEKLRATAHAMSDNTLVEAYRLFILMADAYPQDEVVVNGAKALENELLERLNKGER